MISSNIELTSSVVRAGRQTGNLTVILVGGTLFVILAFALSTELFAKNSPSVLYSQAVDLIRDSDAVRPCSSIMPDLPLIDLSVERSSSPSSILHPHPSLLGANSRLTTLALSSCPPSQIRPRTPAAYILGTWPRDRRGRASWVRQAVLPRCAGIRSVCRGMGGARAFSIRAG